LPLGPRKLRTSSWWTNMLKIISKFKKTCRQGLRTSTWRTNMLKII
jgi:hypothetical protein